jgi:hypothetical protein
MTAPTHADIWEKMSGIDVSEFVQSRSVGNRTLSWIPWSDCLALLQAHYPSFEYEFFPVMLYPDGSAEVGCEVTIGDVSRRVDLPVMDHKFNAIVAGPGSSPDSRAINDGRWRAFVKAVAVLTGLGFQLYRDGSGVPVPVNPSRSERAANLESKVLALETLLSACEEGGTVDHKTVKLCRDIIQNGGPADRADAAIKHLTTEMGSG